MSVAGSAVADRQCAACQAGATFSATNDGTACAAVSAPCAAGFHTTAAATASSDLQCASCADGTFKADTSTILAVDECATWATCAAGQGMSAAGSAVADRQCAACQAGATFSATNDGAACAAVSKPCAAGFNTTVAATASSNLQ
jgi:hypothetical protein